MKHSSLKHIQVDLKKITCDLFIKYYNNLTIVITKTIANWIRMTLLCNSLDNISMTSHILKEGHDCSTKSDCRWERLGEEDKFIDSIDMNVNNWNAHFRKRKRSKVTDLNCKVKLEGQNQLTRDGRCLI